MVATRRGVRVSSPNKTPSDEASRITATPSSTMRTRRRAAAVQSEETSEQTGQSHDTWEETSPRSPPGSTTLTMKKKSCVKLHHAGSSPHEADVSESESCCSIVSEVTDHPITRSRRRAPAIGQGEDEAEPGVLSDDSSASRGPITRRAPRGSQRKPLPSDSASNKTPSRQVSGAESGSSVVSDSSHRMTRSQRRAATASSKSANEDMELSEAESCASSDPSAAQTATVRRATRRGRGRLTQPIALCMEETSEASHPSPARRTRTPRRSVVISKGWGAAEADSEGFESGPSAPATPRRSTRKHAPPSSQTDSESEAMDAGSPGGSVRARREEGTPSSSRTGSGNSGRLAPETWFNTKSLGVLLEKMDPARVPQRGGTGPGPEGTMEEPGCDEDSMLDTTVGADPDCSVTEDDITLTLEEEEEAGDAMDASVVPETAETGLGETGEEREDEGSPDDDVVPAQETVLIPAEDKLSMTRTVSCSPPAMATMSDSPLATATMSDSPPATVTIFVSPPATVTVGPESPAAAEMAEDAVVVGGHERGQSPQDVEVAEAVLTASRLQRGNSPEDVAEDAVTESSLQWGHSPDDVAENEDAVTASSLQRGHSAEEVADSEGSPGHTVTVSGTPGPTVVLMEDDEYDEEEEKEAMDVEAEAQSGTPQQAESREETEVIGQDEEPAPPAPEQAAPPASNLILINADLQGVKVTASDERVDSVIVAKSAIISLLDSSEEEEEDKEEEERGGSGDDEDVLCVGEERAGPSSRPSSSSAAPDRFFIIDTRPGLETADDLHFPGEEAGTEEEEEEEEEEEFVDEEGGDDDDDDDDRVLFTSKNLAMRELSSSIDPGLRVKHLGGLYINFTGSQSKPAPSSLKQLKEKKNQDEVMRKSVIGPEFEKQDAVPPYMESKQALKQKRRVERGKSAGDGWFNMEAPELTPGLRRDLNTLKMRAALDPKRFYKKNDREGFPKYFQVATVVDSPMDFYHSRVPKKQRKRTMVEELMADAEFRQTNKRKYQQIMTEKAAAGAGRKNRKKSKFTKK